MLLNGLDSFVVVEVIVARLIGYKLEEELRGSRGVCDFFGIIIESDSESDNFNSSYSIISARDSAVEEEFNPFLSFDGFFGSISFSLFFSFYISPLCFPFGDCCS